MRWPSGLSKAGFLPLPICLLCGKSWRIETVLGFPVRRIKGDEDKLEISSAPAGGSHQTPDAGASDTTSERK